MEREIVHLSRSIKKIIFLAASFKQLQSVVITTLFVVMRYQSGDYLDGSERGLYRRRNYWQLPSTSWNNAGVNTGGEK